MRVSASIILALCVLIGAVVGFQQHRTPQIRCFRGTRLSSYAEQLRRAKEARSGGGAGQAESSAASYQPPAPMPQSNSAPGAAQQNSDTPFSDDVYEHLSFVISKLSGRMKNSEALNGNDLQKFMNSVDAIITDMQPMGSVPAPPKAGAPSEYVGSTEPLKEDFYIPDPTEKGARRPITEADPNSPFAPLHGMGNTWQVKGMEQMSTEEYFDEVYRRMAVMKEKRSQEEGYSREAARDYFDSINAKNRSR